MRGGAARRSPHALVASCHLSHSYPDGACLYFTFAAAPPPDEIESTYVALWDAGQRAVLAGGGNLSHHHGVGINRARFVAEALGAGLGVLAAVKAALDPNGILNPGKLGLPSPVRRPAVAAAMSAEVTGRWDWDAIRAGGGVALVFAVPFSIAARWAADSRDDSGRCAVWLSLGAVLGFVLGAGCAAWVQRTGTPLTHGIVTAVGTYLARPGRVRRRPPGPRRGRAMVRADVQPHRRARRRPRRRPARPEAAQPRRSCREPGR